MHQIGPRPNTSRRAPPMQASHVTPVGGRPTMQKGTLCFSNSARNDTCRERACCKRRLCLRHHARPRTSKSCNEMVRIGLPALDFGALHQSAEAPETHLRRCMEECRRTFQDAQKTYSFMLCTFFPPSLNAALPCGSADLRGAAHLAQQRRPPVGAAASEA